MLLTNSDSGLDLTSAVTDEVGGQFGWPWTGWSTPRWLFLLGLGLVVGVVGVIVRHLRKRRKGDLPARLLVARRRHNQRGGRATLRLRRRLTFPREDRQFCRENDISPSAL